jgi:hypothetical protein
VWIQFATLKRLHVAGFGTEMRLVLALALASLVLAANQQLPTIHVTVGVVAQEGTVWVSAAEGEATDGSRAARSINPALAVQEFAMPVARSQAGMAFHFLTPPARSSWPSSYRQWCCIMAPRSASRQL